MRKLSERPVNAIGNTVEEAGAKLRLGRPTIYDLMGTGKLRFIKIGRRRIISEEALIECLRNLEAETAAGSAG